MSEDYNLQCYLKFHDITLLLIVDPEYYTWDTKIKVFKGQVHGEQFPGHEGLS